MAQNDYSILPFGARGIPANENAGTALPAPRWYSGTAAPTVGTYNQGDTVFNTTPTASGVFAWVCVQAGTPGTWKTVATGA